jgi:hypothetical protein
VKRLDENIALLDLFSQPGDPRLQLSDGDVLVPDDALEPFDPFFPLLNCPVAASLASPVTLRNTTRLAARLTSS